MSGFSLDNGLVACEAFPGINAVRKLVDKCFESLEGWG